MQTPGGSYLNEVISLSSIKRGHSCGMWKGMTLLLLASAV